MNTSLQTKRLINTFMEMVRIDSESGNETMFARYLQHMATQLRLKNWRDKYCNVYIQVPGVGKPLMLNTHMDTAQPGKGIRPRLVGRYIVSVGPTILGADSKAGIAAMIELVRHCQKNNIRHRPLLLTFSCNEEAGIPTVQHLATDITECIVPDRGSPLGEIIFKAPYAQVYKVTICGKTAYATTHFDNGIHAIRSACEMITHLQMGNINRGTTTNIGVIQGGTMTSMIPDRCYFKGSCYSFHKTSFDNFFIHLQVLITKADKKYGTKSSLEFLEYFPGYSLPFNDPLIKTVTHATKQSKIEPIYVMPKVVTNANLLNSIGIKTIVISTGVENQHTVNERIKVKTLEAIVKILLCCIT